MMCILIHINSSHMFASRTFLLFAQLRRSVHASHWHGDGAMYYLFCMFGDICERWAVQITFIILPIARVRCMLQQKNNHRKVRSCKRCTYILIDSLHRNNGSRHTIQKQYIFILIGQLVVYVTDVPIVEIVNKWSHARRAYAFLAAESLSFLAATRRVPV